MQCSRGDSRAGHENEKGGENMAVGEKVDEKCPALTRSSWNWGAYSMEKEVTKVAYHCLGPGTIRPSPTKVEAVRSPDQARHLDP